MLTTFSNTSPAKFSHWTKNPLSIDAGMVSATPAPIVSPGLLDFSTVPGVQRGRLRRIGALAHDQVVGQRSLAGRFRRARRARRIRETLHQRPLARPSHMVAPPA